MDYLAAGEVGGASVYLVRRPVPGGPSKLRTSSDRPGFDAFFPRGVRLDLSASGGPRLTWAEGTVGPAVPTPPSPWAALSGGVSDPPIGLAFLAGPATLRITGGNGVWRVESESDGWVRFFLPYGLIGLGGDDAGAYGRLAQAVAGATRYWLSNSDGGRLAVRFDETGVRAEWTRAVAGAPIDAALVLARFGGYEARIVSPVFDASAPLADGPQAFAASSVVEAVLPMRTVPPGRAVVIGAPPDPTTLSPEDPRTVLGLAERLVLAPPSVVEGQARGWLADFFARPPIPGSLSAAYAVLAASVGEPFADDGSELAGFASWVLATPSSMVAAGRHEATLALRRILPTFRRRRGLAPSIAPSEGHRPLRDGVFRGAELPGLWKAFADSPLRAIGGSVSAALDGDGLSLAWSEPEPRLLVAPPASIEGAWPLAPGLWLLPSPATVRWSGGPIPRFDQGPR